MEKEGAADVCALEVVLASNVQHDHTVMQPRIVGVGSNPQLKGPPRCNNWQVCVLAQLCVQFDAMLPRLLEYTLNGFADFAVLDGLQNPCFYELCLHVHKHGGRCCPVSDRHRRHDALYSCNGYHISDVSCCTTHNAGENNE